MMIRVDRIVVATRTPTSAAQFRRYRAGCVTVSAIALLSSGPLRRCSSANAASPYVSAAFVSFATTTVVATAQPYRCKCAAVINPFDSSQVQSSFPFSTLAAPGDSCTTMESSSDQSSLVIVQVPCLKDNYGYIIHDPVSKSTAVIDTPEAQPYRRELEKRNWKLTHILNTHQYVSL
jgi:hypothetical protein